jgi:hypothetical protein
MTPYQFANVNMPIAGLENFINRVTPGQFANVTTFSATGKFRVSR